MAGTTTRRGRTLTIRIGPEENIGIIGMRGTGKTHLMERELLPQLRPRVAVWDPLKQYPPDIAYRPVLMDDREDFDRLAGAVFCTQKPYTLMVEEAEQVIPEGPKPLPWTRQLVLMGRNYKQRVVVNIRETALFSKKILRQMDHLFIFKCDGSSIDALVERCGRQHRDTLLGMLSWVKDPRKPGGGRFFHYHDGVLTECDPLDP